MLPSIDGLACVLEVSRETIRLWGKDKPELFGILERLKSIQANALINGGLRGDLNPNITKMMLTKHGFSDKMETDITTQGEKITGIERVIIDSAKT